MKTLFQNPEGATYQRQSEWLKDGWAHAPKEAWEIAKFENSKISAVVRIKQAFWARDGEPEQYWKRFEVVVSNIMTMDLDGNPIPKTYVGDPEATRDFVSRDEALGYYEALLTQYTESYKDDNGELVEVGNKFSRDIPQAPEGANEEVFGSW